MKKIIIFLGVPGSGKGTQAARISSEYGYAHISTGNLLRELLADPHGDPEDKKIASCITEGKMVPDWLIYKLVFGVIEKNITTGNGIVLDGAIRNVAQAQAYLDFFQQKGWLNEVVVIEPHISDETALERLMYRQANSHERRSDDASVDIMRERIQGMGNTQLEPIIAFYRQHRLFIRVDGTKNIEGVAQEIKKVLEA